MRKYLARLATIRAAAIEKRLIKRPSIPVVYLRSDGLYEHDGTVLNDEDLQAMRLRDNVIIDDICILDIAAKDV